MKWYFCCTDFERAKRNRWMIEHKENISGYVNVERYLAGKTVSGPLPYWLVGNRPKNLTPHRP